MSDIPQVFTDSHAHLSYVAQRNPDLYRTMIGAYHAGNARYGEADRWHSGTAHPDGSSLPTSNVEAGVPAALIMDPGVEPDDFPGRLAATGHLSFVLHAAGIWPSKEALADPEEALATLAPHMAHPRCVAVGECGPDFHHKNGSPQAQIRLFEGQIELARRHAKPLIVHSRDAAAETLASLRDCNPCVPVIIHCFGYGPAEVEAFLALGCYISFAGNITYPQAKALREACVLVPAERLLLETDAPYMNPAPKRGSPSTSLDIGRTYELVAGLRGVGIDSLAASVLACLSRITDRDAQRTS